MPTPSEHKTVQARILAYAEAIRLRHGNVGQVGWTIVSREEAEERRAGFPTRRDFENAGRNARAPVRTFNPRYAEAEGAFLGLFRHLHTDIYGNRDFLFSPIVLHSLYDQNDYPSRTTAGVDRTGVDLRQRRLGLRL